MELKPKSSSSLLVAAVVILAVIAGIVYYPDWKESLKLTVAGDKAAHCIAAPGEVCPDAHTIVIAMDVKQLQDELSTPDLRQKVALLNGYNDSLRGSSPGPQYKYDFDKNLWIGPPPVPVKAAETPAAPPPALPAKK